MIVIDNEKKIIVKLQGKSSCQHNKICGHSFLRALKKIASTSKHFLNDDICLSEDSRSLYMAL